MKIIIIEPSRRQDGNEQVIIDGPLWREMCETGRLNGYAMSDETVLPYLDARLFADALRRGATAGPLAESQNQGKVRRVLALLERGGVVITRRNE